MTRFILRLAINALALLAAVRLVPGVSFAGGPLALAGVALVFGALNALVRPVLRLLSCPLLILTLGLFTFVLNAVMLRLTAGLSGALGLRFEAPLFLPAFLGALVVSLVSTVLSWLLFEGDDDRAGRHPGRRGE
jgi:putative membrane protein